MDLVVLFVSICGIVAICLGSLLNSFVILKLMRRQRSINDVFPLNMAFADIFCLISELLGIVQILGWPGSLVKVHAPAFICVLGAFTEYVCILLSGFSFFSYFILRFFVIMKPLKCKVYLKKRYMFGVAAFNLVFSILQMSDYLYVYSDLLTSTEIIPYFGWETRKRPAFYDMFRTGLSYSVTSMYIITTLLVAYTCYYLAKKHCIADQNNAIRRKQKAIRTICLSFFVFTAFQVVFVLVVVAYSNKMISKKLLWSFFIFRLYGYCVNPLLYYKAENSVGSVRTKHISPHPEMKPLARI